jgi:predicted ester cyclase
MSTEANKDLVRKLFDEGFNQRALGLVDELVAADFVGHFLGGSPATRGQEGFRGWMTGVFAALPDWRGTLDDVIAEGDRVAFRWTVEGTPEGRAGAGRITQQGIEICRYADGRLAELWHCQDAPQPQPAVAATT